MKKNTKWIITITLIAFFLSIIFSLLCNEIENVNVIIGIFIMLLFVIIGILFDIIGVAIQSSEVSPFHSMASKKIKGADTAIKLVENSDKVSSICNDVVGDVCGVVSGSMSIIIANVISKSTNISITISTLLITGLVAALTIGGKAVGKGFAVNKSEYIVTKISKLISVFNK